MNCSEVIAAGSVSYTNCSQLVDRRFSSRFCYYCGVFAIFDPLFSIFNIDFWLIHQQCTISVHYVDSYDQASQA